MSATVAPFAIAPTTTWAETADPFLFRRFRTWWLMLALLLLADENSIFTVAITPSKSLATLGRNLNNTPTTLLQAFTILLWAIIAGLIVKRLGSVLRLMLKQKVILSFAVLAFLSLLWSHDPPVTFRRAAGLLLIFVFAWFFASCYAPEDQMRLLLVAGVIMALASILMAILLPQYGLDWGGEWKGVFGQKNQLGHSVAFLFSGLAFRPISNSRRLLTVVIQAIVPIGLIVLSRSAGSLILVAVLIVMRFYGPFLRRRRREQLPFILYATVVGALALVLGRDVILSLLGRDSTLTGRTQEWAVLTFYAFKHLWLGYGFQGFWGSVDSVQAMISVGGAMHGADSGYVDTILQFGLVGMALWLILLLVVLRNFVSLLRGPFVPLEGYWYAGIILATFAVSVVEVLFPVPVGISTFVFVVACAGLNNLCNPTVHLATGSGL